VVVDGKEKSEKSTITKLVSLSCLGTYCAHLFGYRNTRLVPKSLSCLGS